MPCLPYAGTALHSARKNALCRHCLIQAHSFECLVCLMQALPFTGIAFHRQHDAHTNTHTHFFSLSQTYKAPWRRLSLNHCSIRHLPARLSPRCIAPPPFATAFIIRATDPTKDSSLYDQPCMQLVHLHCFAKCQKRLSLIHI